MSDEASAIDRDVERPLAGMDFIGVLTNVHSRRNLHGTYNATRLGNILRGHGLVRECRERNRVAGIVSEFRERGVNVIGVNGGDGTWGALLTEAFRQYPPDRMPAFLPLRGGTMNMVANELNLRGDPARLLVHYVEALEGRNPPPGLHWFKTLRLDQVGSPAPRYGFVWACGMAYRFLREYYARAPASLFNALWTTTSLIAGAPLPLERFRRAWQRTPARFQVDGQDLPHDEVRVAVASTVYKLVLWFSPFGRGVGGADEGFGFMFNNMPTARVMANIWALSRGRLQDGQNICRVARRVRVTTGEGYVFDGETFPVNGEVQLELSQGPTITILAPLAPPGPFSLA